MRRSPLLTLACALLTACARPQDALANPLAPPHRAAHASPMRTARRDPHLSARIVARRALTYAAGADVAQDRPAYVRAASGLAWVGERLAVAQDDAHFVALVAPDSGLAEAVALPADDAGRRLFDDTRGTKHLKLDLESCFSEPRGAGVRFVALGSGSTPRRTSIVTLDFASAREAPALQVFDARALYEALADNASFSGSALNVEGVIAHGDELWLFQRGNGAPSKTRAPVSAIGVLSRAAFDRYLAGRGPVPRLEAVQQVDLGSVRGVPYAFTDATLAPDGRVLFLASAEDSQSTVSDGAVLGTLVGEIDDDGGLRTTLLEDEHGADSQLKAEAIALDPHDPARAYVVVDVDDPTRPSELLEVRLGRTSPLPR